jgi:hypothetical protein
VVSEGYSAYLVAKTNIESGQDEEPDREADEDEIVHGAHHTDQRFAGLIKYPALSIKKTLRPSGRLKGEAAKVDLTRRSRNQVARIE